MSLREKLERAKPTVDSPTYRRLTNQIDDKSYRKAIQEETRRIQHPPTQTASER